MICRLARGVKPRLAFVETIAPEAEPERSSQNTTTKIMFSLCSQEELKAVKMAWEGPHNLNGRMVSRWMQRAMFLSEIAEITSFERSMRTERSALLRDLRTTMEKWMDVGAAARFCHPMGLAMDAAGNVYVADSNNRAIRKVTPSGAVTTLADSNDLASRAPGPGDPPAEPLAVAVDKKGNVYVAMRNDYIIRKIAPEHTVTTLAGLAGTSGTADGQAKSARFVLPQGVAVDDKGNVYVADMSTVRKIDPSGTVTTLAGSPDKSGRTDGTGSAAQFVNLQDVAVDSAGNVYGADSGNKNVRKITPAGVVKTLRDVRNESPFVKPVAIAVDDKGWIYVADEDAFNIVVGKPAK